MNPGIPLKIAALILFASLAAQSMGAADGAAHIAPKAVALTIRLQPQAAPNGGTIDRVGITLQFYGVLFSDRILLRLPLIASNVDTDAKVLEDLSARDENGPLRLLARDVTLPEENARDSTGGGPSREWVAEREPHGVLTVTYTVPADATLPPRGPAPPFSFSNDDGGVSAVGQVFVLLPPGNPRYQTRVEWDLSRSPSGSRGISSLGEGAVQSAEPLSGAEIRESFYMAGRIRTWPHQVPISGFFAAWQGSPPFDTPKLMAWTGQLYGHYSQFFGQKSPPHYGVFLRYNPINAGGGVGLYHSFVATFGKERGDGSDLKDTLAHEMFHTFQPYIQEPVGLASSWFGEGLAVFYAGRLALRFHAISPDEFLKNLNFYAARYSTSLMATAPNSEVAKRFWADTRIRTLPYDRGMLYFATVDDELRKSSGGKRTLDDLMMAMLRLSQSGKTTTNADWELLLDENLGPKAVEEFHAFLDGRLAVPPSDAFGPCFRRTARPMRRYEVGFEPAVLAEPKRIVRGLVPNSAAAQAGLKDGDEIVKPVPQDAIQGTQNEVLKLKVRRDGKVFPVSYLPRGETVQATQWERIEDVPDSSCAR